MFPEDEEGTGGARNSFGVPLRPTSLVSSEAVFVLPPSLEDRDLMDLKLEVSRGK